jgi:hypothetical protein
LIQVPKKVYEGLEAVRSSGVTNMFDYPKVIYFAGEWGYEETVQWLKEHKKEYSLGVFQGFEIEK